MQVYKNLLEHILTTGIRRDDRTGIGTISTFGYQLRINLQEGFPLLTTKKIHVPSVVHELLWFLQGSTNIQYLKENKVRIWDEWADENGDLGPVYGKQWRSWQGANNTTIDQISEVIHAIKTNPNSRRLVVSAWNVADIADMALPPCHCLFQFYVQDNKLSCQLYQRSADAFLGVPFNIASYALLTHMIAKVTGLEVGDFIHTFGDLHIYTNHLDQVNTLIARDCKTLPTLSITHDTTNIFDIEYKHILIENYHPHPAIKADVAV